MIYNRIKYQRPFDLEEDIPRDEAVNKKAGIARHDFSLVCRPARHGYLATHTGSSFRVRRPTVTVTGWTSCGVCRRHPSVPQFPRVARSTSGHDADMVWCLVASLNCSHCNLPPTSLRYCPNPSCVRYPGRSCSVFGN